MGKSSKKQAHRSGGKRSDGGKQQTQTTNQLNLTLVVVVLVVCLAAAAGLFYGKQMGQDVSAPKTNVAADEVVPGGLPDVFLLDVCRLNSCKKIQMKTADGFEASFLRMREALGVGSSGVSIVNQTGARISSLSGLYSASEERGKERGLGETWRGAKLLIGDEKFFWPLPKSGKGRNDTTFGETFVHYLSDGYRGFFFFFFFRISSFCNSSSLFSPLQWK